MHFGVRITQKVDVIAFDSSVVIGCKLNSTSDFRLTLGGQCKYADREPFTGIRLGIIRRLLTVGT